MRTSPLLVTHQIDRGIVIKVPVEQWDLPDASKDAVSCDASLEICLITYSKISVDKHDSIGTRTEQSVSVSM